MAAGFIDLFRKVWGWLSVDSGVAEEVGAQMCVSAKGVYVPCEAAQLATFAACSARTASYPVLESLPVAWSLDSPVGSHIPGMKSAKGFGCA